MTTAHRPTFDPARGKDAQRGPAYHQRLQPAHMHLKTRQAGQGGTGGQARRDLRAELLKAEANIKARKQGSGGHKMEIHNQEGFQGGKRNGIEPEDKADSDGSEESEETKRRRLTLEEAAAVDAESDSAEDDDAGSDSEESSEDDDDDEEAELMRELAKIKAERAAQRAAEDAAKAKEDEEARMVEIARGNPLLNKSGSYGVKRRWDDDVVFKNQARGTEEKGKRKEFVNDLLRSDFHKRFMSKYVR